MSSDLLEDCVDKNGVDCGLIMNAYSYAWLSIGDFPTANFELSPDEHGFKNAQSIIDALRSWIQQVKSTQ